jgi:hypothetical protein
MKTSELFILVTILAVSSIERGFAQDKVFVNVKDFGAAGDGKHDDYAALLKVVDYVNSKGKGEVYFPPGNYYIAAFHDGKNDIRDLQFENCDGLYIHGPNAVISVNGNFKRTVTKETNKHKFSNILAVKPLKINHCKNVSIKSLEIDGNVNEMLRDTGVVEVGGGLLTILESQNVTLSNLSLHHSQTDGLNIQGNSTKNVIAKGIVSSNNARQGMSIIGLTDGTFTDCKFINTGITEGTYGKHAPAAGVDIEPIHKQPVNNIHFINCLFENNLGSQFVCSSPVTTKNVLFDSCKFNAGDKSSKFSIITNAVNVVFKNSFFDCKNGSIYPVWRKEGSSSIFKQCMIKSNNSGFVAVNDLRSSTVIIDSCTLEYTGIKEVGSFFPYIRMQNFSFTNNIIHIPEKYFKNTGFTSLIEGAKLVSNIKFYSDQKPVKPKISYKGSKVNDD